MDDNEYVMNNPLIKRSDGLHDIWLKPSASPHYYPLVFTTFFIENRIYGDQPRGYVIVNVLLHAISSCLIYLILQKLKIPGAWLAAMIFAIHPMNVESVAWITERKNSLAMFFSMLSSYLVLIATLSPKQLNRRLWLLLVATLFFACALMSKSASCVVPPMLLVALWWYKRRIAWPDAILLGVWFLIAILSGLLTAQIESSQVHADTSNFHFSWSSRLLVVGQNWWFYPTKFLWPYPLSFIYPRWHIPPETFWAYTGLPLVIIVSGVMWFYRRLIGSVPLILLILYTLAIGPALGVLNIAYFRLSFVSDHFAYWATIPLALGLAIVVMKLSGLRQSSRTLRACASLTVIMILTIISWNRSHAYASPLVLYEDTLKKNPENKYAWTLYGQGLMQEKQYAKARDALAKAVSLPGNDMNNYGLVALACINLGEYNEAEHYLDRALAEQPFNDYAYHIMGILRHHQHRPDEAVECFLRAYQLNPSYLRSIMNAAMVLVEQQKFDRAIQCYETALQINPRSAIIHDLLGRSLAASGNLGMAVNQFQIACSLDDNPEFRADLDRARQLLANQQGEAGTQPTQQSETP